MRWQPRTPARRRTHRHVDRHDRGAHGQGALASDDLADGIRPTRVGATAEHQAVTDARHDAAPQRRKHDVLMLQVQNERCEQVGEEAEEHKTGDGLHDVLEATGAHHHKQQQRVHDDGLYTDGQADAGTTAELGDDGRKTGEPACRETVGNHEHVRGERGDGATEHDGRQVAHELRLNDAVDIDAPCHVPLLRLLGCPTVIPDDERV